MKWIYYVFGMIIIFGCEEVSRENLIDKELLNQTIIENLSLQLVMEDTIIEKPFGICGNSSDEELKNYFYFNGEKNKRNLEKITSLTYIPVNDLNKIPKSKMYSYIELQISGNILSNSKIEIFERYYSLDSIYSYIKIYQYSKKWKLISTKPI